MKILKRPHRNRNRENRHHPVSAENISTNTGFFSEQTRPIESRNNSNLKTKKRSRRKISVNRLSCVAWCGSSKNRSVTDDMFDVPSIAGRLLRAGSISDNEYADIITADFVYRLGGDSPSAIGHLPRCSSAHEALVSRADKCNQTKPDFEKWEKDLTEFKNRDPITLEDLGSWTWEFVYSSHVDPSSPEKPKTQHISTKYNVESLVQYLVHSGDFYEPITRIPFTWNQVEELDNLASLAGVKTKMSLVDAWNASRNLEGSCYQLEKDRREMLLGCDRCLGEIISEMLNAIEGENAELGQMQLVTLFPQFSHIFNELSSADKSFSLQCLSDYFQTLKGPPNNPTTDPMGLLPAALSFLKDLENMNESPVSTDG